MSPNNSFFGHYKSLHAFYKACRCRFLGIRERTSGHNEAGIHILQVLAYRCFPGIVRTDHVLVFFVGQQAIAGNSHVEFCGAADSSNRQQHPVSGMHSIERATDGHVIKGASFCIRHIVVEDSCPRICLSFRNGRHWYDAQGRLSTLLSYLLQFAARFPHVFFISFEFADFDEVVSSGYFLHAPSGFRQERHEFRTWLLVGYGGEACGDPGHSSAVGVGSVPAAAFVHVQLLSVLRSLFHLLHPLAIRGCIHQRQPCAASFVHRRDESTPSVA
mmetsp:Transcript_4597/g.29154  ORF Transcript_4597/g.29154 Transcript_4597/m.29154 type:complete len:273 (+) Transcript_4597:1670-2488(+)